jgi:predicted nucleic acid-binding protein
MSDRHFLDTNLFIYSLDTAAPVKAQKAHDLIRAAIAQKTGFISFQVVQEFFNVAFRRFSPRMSLVEAERYLHSILHPLLAVHSSAALYTEALNLHAAGGLAWYDALIVAGALQARCSILYTEDLQHGRKFGALKIVNPFL